MKDTFFSSNSTLNCQGKLHLIDTPKVMGILNATADSFYKNSSVQFSETLNYVKSMIEAGVDIIDVGGQSTRPGAKPIDIKQEINNVIPIIEQIKDNFDVVVSVDTFNSQVAKSAVESGADIVNDISGGQLDDHMFTTVAQLNVPYILMHMRGTPETMQQMTNYEDLLSEILHYFTEKIQQLNTLGVKDIIIDPGFGFSKTVEQNLEIVRNLNYFNTLNKPILLGVSRKSSIQKTLEVSSEDALNGTSILNTMGLMNGAKILRVHDVKEAKECVKLFQMTYSG